MDPHFEFMSSPLALLGSQCHLLSDIPFIRCSKSTGLVHDPLHALILARPRRPTTPREIHLGWFENLEIPLRLAAYFGYGLVALGPAIMPKFADEGGNGLLRDHRFIDPRPEALGLEVMEGPTR